MNIGGKVFLNQTMLRIWLNCGQDVSIAATTRIKYKDPNGVTGTWNASVYTTNNKRIYYDLPLTPIVLNNLGVWGVWSYITFSDGRSAPGDTYYFRVYEEGK